MSLLSRGFMGWPRVQTFCRYSPHYTNILVVHTECQKLYCRDAWGTKLQGYKIKCILLQRHRQSVIDADSTCGAAIAAIEWGFSAFPLCIWKWSGSSLYPRIHGGRHFVVLSKVTWWHAKTSVGSPIAGIFFVLERSWYILEAKCAGLVEVLLATVWAP